MAYSAELSSWYLSVGCAWCPFHTRLEELNSCSHACWTLESSLPTGGGPPTCWLHMAAAAAFSSLLVPCSMHLLFPYFISDLLLLSPNQEGNAPNDRPTDQDFLRESYYF